MSGRSDLHDRPTTNHACCQWLLSGHPDARAERHWRRGTYLESAQQTAADFADWAARVSADPGGHTPAARDLAASIGPRAAASATRAEIESAEPDDLYVARLRKQFETHMHAHPGSPDPRYRYPDWLTGPGAARYPPPDPGPGGTEPGLCRTVSNMTGRDGNNLAG